MPGIYRRNGESLASELALDRGLMYGDSVFTTIAVSNNEPKLLERHIERILSDAESLNFNPVSRESILSEITFLAAQRQKAVLRIGISRGAEARGYAYKEPTPVLWSILEDWPERIEAKRRAGIQIRFCEQRLSENQQLAGLKHGNRLEQILARSEWKSSEISEGLMMDSADRVIEGTMSNLFILKDSDVLTPTIDKSGVSGVMRREVLDCLAEIGVCSKEQSLYKDDILDADGLFMTNSVIGVWPVVKVIHDSKEPKNFNIPSLMNELLERLQTRNSI